MPRRFQIPATQGDTTSDGANQARAWSVTPRVGLTGTLTDNINLSSTDKQTGFITQLSPGIRIDARTARLKMFLDYSLNGLRYSTGNSSNQAQNALNTFGTLEAIDNWLFLDFSGQIYNRSLIRSVCSPPATPSSTQTRPKRQPIVFLPLSRASWVARPTISCAITRQLPTTQNGSLSDVSLSQWLGQVRGNTRFQNLNWTIDGSQQNTDYSRGRNYEDARLRGLLTYQLYPEFRISGSGGYETNNYQSIDNEGQSTYGYGFDWTPTERTQVSGFKEHRFFGNGHNVLLSHRFPLSSIRYTDVRDVALIPNQSSTIGLGTVYDQYFDQFASLIPDAAARAAYVTNLLNQAGIAPNAQAVSDYAAQRPRVQRSQQLSMVLYGSRNSITFLAARNENEALTVFGQNTAIAGEASRIVQQGYTLSFLHRLTPLTGLNLLGSRCKSKSGLTNALDTTTTILSDRGIDASGCKNRRVAQRSPYKFRQQHQPL